MSEQYRLPVPQCPLCGGLLEQRSAADAIVDVCADCHAVWIDWFDGDLSTVAAEVRVKNRIPESRAGDKRCPRCRAELGDERLRGHGPSVLRCASCAGVLVPSAIIAEVAAMDPIGAETAPDQGLLDRLFTSIRSLFSPPKS